MWIYFKFYWIKIYFYEETSLVSKIIVVSKVHEKLKRINNKLIV